MVFEKTAYDKKGACTYYETVEILICAGSIVYFICNRLAGDKTLEVCRAVARLETYYERK